MQAGLVYPYGAPVIDAALKSVAEDFVVSEELGFAPDGDGEHLLLLVEKMDIGTAELIERVARAAGIAPRAVGYCGLKDRHAVARQWLSLQLPGKDTPLIGDGDAYRVVEQARHRRKLRPGCHRGNHFRIRLRGVASLPETSRAQLARIRESGFANYFGAQRFGRDRDNVEQALARLGRDRLGKRHRGLLISALRSFLFNRILSRRIAEGYWELPLDGDLFMLRGSRSVFGAQIDETILARFRELDISSTASLYGGGDSRLGGPARALEASVFADYPAITACLDAQGSKLQMRSLRVAPERFDYDYDSKRHCLELAFELPPGSYATILIAHFAGIGEAG